jgi:hypothetical protein
LNALQWPVRLLEGNSTFTRVTIVAMCVLVFNQIKCLHQDGV